jgi:hypothetical protein
MPNLADLSTATKVLLGAGVLMFIDLFLSWQKVCVSAPGFPEQCGTRSGWAGWGVLIGLLTIALIAWEGITLAGIASNLNVPVAATIVSAALAAGILVFTILKFLVDNEARSWPAWLGLLLALAIAAGGWLKWKETPEMAPARTMDTPAAAPPPPPPPGEPPPPPPA